MCHYNNLPSPLIRKYLQIIFNPRFLVLECILCVSIFYWWILLREILMKIVIVVRKKILLYPYHGLISTSFLKEQMYD